MNGELDFVTELGQLTVHITGEGIDVFGPASSPASPEVPPTREALRELARTDPLGRYRPLSGARTLPGNWRAHFADLESFTAAVGEVYPLAFEHNAQWETGELRVVGLEAVLARHSGRYGGAKELDADGRELARRVLCARCVRVPVWAAPAAAKLPPGGIACPEPCSVMVALCREAAIWQKERPARAQPDAAVAFAAFAEPGNEVREAYLRARYPEQDG
ncbi:MAG: hypothetical protein IT303_03125 [Dehalococcoidia bacterium]|nr:hypothetical protein [Dehalococcoidia bacterium]